MKKQQKSSDIKKKKQSVRPDYVRNYLDTIVSGLEKIYSNQQEMINKCAAIIADRIAEDGLIYVFGSGGHSNMMAEEMFHRAGGLACVSPVFVDSIRIPHVPLGERSYGIVPYIFDFYEIEKNDVLLLVNGYGINPVTIETALEAKKRGVKVIAVTSTDYAERLPKDFVGRHPSGSNLHEMFEHVLLTYMPYGDAIVNIDEIESGVGSYSTFANAFICNSLVIEAANILAQRGIDPPIINSINVIDGFEKNRKLYKKYRNRIRWL
ncbi:MAG: sugar isomerase domain-containing protein [Phycisphaerae bacterium]